MVWRNGKLRHWIKKPSERAIRERPEPFSGDTYNGLPYPRIKGVVRAEVRMTQRGGYRPWFSEVRREYREGGSTEGTRKIVQ